MIIYTNKDYEEYPDLLEKVIREKVDESMSTWLKVEIWEHRFKKIYIYVE